VLPTEDNPPEMDNKPALIELATQIVAAYVTKNPVEQADLPKLITEVHRALEKAAAGPAPGKHAPQPNSSPRSTSSARSRRII
jgi:predicted transcriptional regulator